MLGIYLLDPFYFSENAIFVLVKEKRKHARISPDMNDFYKLLGLTDFKDFTGFFTLLSLVPDLSVCERICL